MVVFRRVDRIQARGERWGWGEGATVYTELRAGVYEVNWAKGVISGRKRHIVEERIAELAGLDDTKDVSRKGGMGLR